MVWQCGEVFKVLEYPKPMMKTSELKAMGFAEEFLMVAYRSPDNDFATKINPMKKNSSILYDTAGFDAWRQKQIKMQVKSMQRGR